MSARVLAALLLTLVACAPPPGSVLGDCELAWRAAKSGVERVASDADAFQFEGEDIFEWYEFDPCDHVGPVRRDGSRVVSGRVSILYGGEIVGAYFRASVVHDELGWRATGVDLR